MYEETRAVLKVFVSILFQDAVVNSKHVNRKAVTTMDVTHALKFQGRALPELMCAVILNDDANGRHCD
ncbi:hypothetical protein PC116_g18822 [Phytophthora cactorum]|uniref:Histone-fold n=1 Tax=Phytophthora cactorum TaxID=29920 RepID=A0A8T1FT10_9STRA|nr:hypothetical protein PC113_g14773 [Phytophthora cactorum]KAG2894317.1 hypothetical protein PC114_g15967 [Phytophthora cactorum]KAG2907229.1 hypothetical protein PC115_g14031 [Phytophthora cactorum]KAG2921300.1 hypothetical protein PC117_g16286 [Phytophthora cactorum]KAG2974207.1 hypothetical protein PC118_g14680 [Phytophthora cactorum]